ncbi:MAG: hypothetical protein HOG64_01205 [Flavobacteriaceae bacterium]|nr:hypothetical protein [Flavobacteriaceae bacterium]
MKYRSVQNLDEFIKTIGSVRAVKNIDEWKWQSRFPDFETAVNHLLKQLHMQRELLLMEMLWQREILLEQNKSISKNN